jgi:heme oxygenase
VLSLQHDDLTIESYRIVLAKLYGFWATWETQVGELYNDDAFLAPRRRAYLLAADLTSLQISDLDSLPRCPRIPLKDRCMALGSIYVMEGSSLGGRVILRNVERSLGDTGKDASKYFAGYGERTGIMWREFLVRLEDTSPRDRELVSLGALATFESFAAWFRMADNNVLPALSYMS